MGGFLFAKLVPDLTGSGLLSFIYHLKSSFSFKATEQKFCMQQVTPLQKSF